MNLVNILSLYLVIGTTFGFAILTSESHKKDSMKDKFVLFFTMTFFWLIGILFPLRESKNDSELIERLDVGNPIGNFNLTAEDAPVYPSGSFADGTSKLTVVEV